MDLCRVGKLSKLSSCLRVFLFLGCAFLAACGEGEDNKAGAEGAVQIRTADFDREEFVAAMRAALPAQSDTSGKKELADLSAGMRAAYEAANHGPLWVSEDGGAPKAGRLLAELDSLRWDGLNPESYHLSELRSQSSNLKGAELEQLVRFDTLCTAAYLRASRDLLLGVVPVRRADSLWFHANDSAWKAPAVLARSKEYVSLDSFRSGIGTYRALRSELQRLARLSKDSTLMAVKKGLADSAVSDSLLALLINAEAPGADRTEGADTLQGTRRLITGFQINHALKATGKLDSTTRRILRRHPDSSARLVWANLERLRWLPRKLSDRYILVNVPQMELLYRDGGRDEMKMKVVVGKPSRQTPTLSAPLQNVVFNPPWGVPPTILKKDVLPGIARKGNAYLAKKGLKAYDRKGRQVDAWAINASNVHRYHFRQPPGPRNALGEIKFNMPNRWDIYLHDTPDEWNFSKQYRALSSGCVRLHKPKELAELILVKLEGKEGFDQFKIDSLILTRATKAENLENKIPVHIVYLTAFESDAGGVRYLSDIYKKDSKLLALLP